MDALDRHLEIVCNRELTPNRMLVNPLLSTNDHVRQRLPSEYAVSVSNLDFMVDRQHSESRDDYSDLSPVNVVEKEYEFANVHLSSESHRLDA